MIVIIPFLVVGMIIALVAFLIPTIRRTSVSGVTRPATPAGKDQPAGFAKPILNFGSEGIGPGMFKDARSIAVDGSGKITWVSTLVRFGYLADGIFRSDVCTNPLRGLASDRKGTVHSSESDYSSRSRPDSR